MSVFESIKGSGVLSFDFASVLNAMRGDDEARKVPISISVYLDDSAAPDLVGRVRNLFASAADHARITIGYLGNAQAVPNPTDDMAVIVAAAHKDAGRLAADIRAAGVPALVVTSSPGALARVTRESGHPIPEDDLVVPCAAAGEEEPFALTDEAIEGMKEQMGKWIIANCEERRLAFATAFPFVCRPLALDAVMLTSIENGIVGALSFIPVANWPIMTLNQIKMVLQIAAAYGVPLDQERAKELVAVAAGGYGCRMVARNVAGAVPVLGIPVKASVGFGGTQAIGRVALEYFENGAGPAGLGHVVTQATGAVVRGVEAVQAAANGEEPAEEPEPEGEKSVREQVADAAGLWGGRARKAGSVAAKVAVPLARKAGAVGVTGAKGVTNLGVAAVKAKASSVLGGRS